MRAAIQVHRPIARELRWFEPLVVPRNLSLHVESVTTAGLWKQLLGNEAHGHVSECGEAIPFDGGSGKQRCRNLFDGRNLKVGPLPLLAPLRHLLV